MLTLTPRVLKQLIAAVGARSVHSGPETQAAYETATFLTRQRILAVVQPSSRAQVQACLRIANAARIPVYPVSQGKNWGYGCRVPPRSGALIVELRRMNRILAFDETLGTVTLEPGVSFAQLGDYLREAGSTLVAPRIGSTSEGSVLANALERGLGFGLSGNRADLLVGLEAVTAQGDVVHTGMTAWPGARTGTLQRAGLGPSLDGLFFQSNLGVVTRATVWLPRRPRYIAQLDLQFSKSAFPRVFAALRDAQEQGQLPGLLKVFNGYATLAITYPEWSTRLPEGALLPRRVAPPRLSWSASLFLAGATAPELNARLRSLQRLLRDAEERHPTPAKKVTPSTDNPYLGSAAIGGAWPAYWRHPAPLPAAVDLHAHGRGALFFAPVLPHRAREVAQATALFERTCLTHGFDPSVTLNADDSRSVRMVGAIYFDRRARGEDRRALACMEACHDVLGARGYVPYRMGIQAMENLPARAGDTDRILRKLRKALDPHHILAPGRYQSRWE